MVNVRRPGSAWRPHAPLPSNSRNIAAYAQRRRKAAASATEVETDIDYLLNRHKPGARERPKVSKVNLTMMSEKYMSRSVQVSSGGCCGKQEVEEHWRGFEDAIDKHTAKAQLAKLNPNYSYPFGVPPLPQKAKKPQLYEEFLDFKKQHPTKIILVQVRPESPPPHQGC